MLLKGLRAAPPSTGAANRVALPWAGRATAGPAAAGLECRALPIHPRAGEGWGCPKVCPLTPLPSRPAPLAAAGNDSHPSSAAQDLAHPACSSLSLPLMPPAQLAPPKPARSQHPSFPKSSPASPDAEKRP